MAETSTSSNADSSSELSKALELCRNIFTDEKLTIIENQGDYALILKLQLSNDVAVQIMISDLSQDALMDVFVKGNVPILHQQEFNREITDFRTVQDLTSCVNVVKLWWDAYEQQRPIELAAEKQAWKNENKKKKKNKSHQKQEATEVEDTAAQSHRGMKTAEDVVHRILWDSDLDKEQFVVGYIDRFLGIQEKPFTDFNWDHFSNVDPEASAVPRHRIQYFRYKNTKVWDRASRLDLVFNSTSNTSAETRTIHDVIRDENAKDATIPLQNQENSSDESAPGSDQEPSSYSVVDQIVPENTPSDLAHGQRPTHYLALQLNSEKVKAQIREVQQNLKSQCPNCVKSMSPTEHLHITLALFTQDQDIDRVAIITNNLAAELNQILSNATLIITGLELLYQYRVVVGVLDLGQNLFLQQIMNLINQAFNNAKVQFYAPSKMHLTLLKLRPTMDARRQWQPLANVTSVSRFRVSTNELSLTLKRVGKANISNELLGFAIGSRENSTQTTKFAESSKAEDASNDENNVFIGCHIKDAYKMVTDSFTDAVYSAAAVGAKSLAFFLSDKSTWAETRLICDREATKFKQTCQQCDIKGANIVVHGVYVLAPGHPCEHIRARSVDKMTTDIRVCDKLGIKYYNIHVEPHDNTGTRCKDEEFQSRVAESLNQSLSNTNKCDVIILLETAAGQNGERGARFEELRNIIDKVENQTRIGVCIDTCHVFAAGHDISTPQGYEMCMKSINQIIGWERVKAVHLNDSKCLPLILETPVLPDNHLHEIMQLNGFVGKRNRKCLSDSERRNKSTTEELTQKIRNFHAKHKISDETSQKMEEVRKNLEKIAKNAINENVTVCIIGSVASGLGTEKSDLDLVLITSPEKLGSPLCTTSWQSQIDFLRKLQSSNQSMFDDCDLRMGYVPVLRMLAKCQGYSVQVVTATRQFCKTSENKVLRALVHHGVLERGKTGTKVVHCIYIKFLKLYEVDLTCDQSYSVFDTELLRAYTQLDARFARLCVTLKHWLNARGISDGTQGYPNGYTYVLLLLHSLQCAMQPPVLPNIQTSWPNLCQEKPENLRTINSTHWQSENQTSEGELFLEFLKFVVEFPFAEKFVSIRNGCAMDKEFLENPTEKNESFLMYVEDPFEQRNTARALTESAKLEEIRHVFRSELKEFGML